MITNPKFGRISVATRSLIAGAAAVALTHNAWAITHAQQLFINDGLVLMNASTPGDDFNLNTYTNLGYTSTDWESNGETSLLGNFPWSRWVGSPSDMPGGPNETAETPYLKNLVSLELGDELNLNDPTDFNTEVSWFQQAEAQLPNAILFTTSYAGQVSDSTLGNLISQTNPGMICFDEYPFQSTYVAGGDGNPEDTSTYTPQPADITDWMSQLWRYRQFGIEYNVPMGTYMQTFHSVEDYDDRVYRDPSDTELTLNTFLALAFNAKALIGFDYNPSSSEALFTAMQDRPGHLAYGDTFPNDGSPGRNNNLYTVQQQVNAEATNFGKALVQLQPIPDMHKAGDASYPAGSQASGVSTFADGTTTSILILKSNPGSNSGGLPGGSGFVNDPGTAGNSESWWEIGKNDPYLHGWTVTNNDAAVNGGKAGEVVISWFTPLDESLDGPSYNNEIYMMVVNALTDPSSSNDCTQTISLNFKSTIPHDDLIMLDPDTGTLETVPLTLKSGYYFLTLTLTGGEAALFKFDDGAPFVGINNQAFVPEPGALSLVGITMLGLMRRRATKHA